MTQTDVSQHTHPPMLQNVEIERGDDGQATLRITVLPEAVQAAREAVIRDYARQMRVPGFRPGKVPANIVRRQIGDDAITQKISDDLVPHAYQHALADSGLQPLDRAQVDDLTFDAFDGETPLTFVARVVLRPDIELPDLAGLEIEHPSVEISDDELEQGIQALREERATLSDIEGRGAQDGDVVAGELSVFVDGEQRGEMARLRPFLLGQSGFVPKIDDQLIGATLDEERRFPITYPEDFQDAELAGKEAEFAVKVTALKKRNLPELGDEFAQQAGVANVDELRVRMREFLSANKERDARDQMRAELAARVAEQAGFEAPRAMTDARYQARFEQMQRDLAQRGASFDSYLKEADMTPDEFEVRGREEITEELRRELVLDEIARQQRLDVSGDELEQYYVRMSQSLQRPIEQLVQEVEVSSVRASILQRKAVDYLLSQATILNAPQGDSDTVDAEDLASEVADEDAPLVAAELEAIEAEEAEAQADETTV